MKNEQRETEEQTAKRVIEAMDQIDAHAAHMSLEVWRALPENEKIRLEELAEYEASTAKKYSRVSLDEYRADLRRRIEAGEMQEPYTGFPSWLRDQYAAERPVEIAVEYLSLLTALETTAGAAQKEIIRKISERTRRGWVIDRTVEEARALLLEEIARAGLGEYFEEAEAEQRKQADR